MPITGYYDEAQQENDRLQRQAQLNQALQAFSGFVQKNREQKQNAPLINAQTQNYLAETQAKQFENQRKQNALNAYLKQQQQASFPTGMIPSPTGWTPNPNAGQMQTGQAIVKERENPLTGEKEITPEYQQYISSLNKQKAKEIEDRQIRVAKELQNIRGSEGQPMNADSAGRYAFASEAKRNLPKLKSLLTTEDGAYNQDLAVKLTYPWKYPRDKEVQNARRWLTGAMTARGLIQSGTVVKDNEWGRLLQQFGIDFLNDPEASFSSIDENTQFMDEYQKLIRPSSNSSVSESDLSDPSDNDVSDILEGL